MGKDKAQLELHGTTILARTIDELRTISDDVLVVGRQLSEPPEVRSLPDHVAGRGPIGGLLTGLRAARFPLCAVVACDLPFLDAAVLRSLLGLAHGYDAVVPCTGGQQHPLHAVYQRGVLPKVEEYIAGAGQSMRGLLSGLRVRWVCEEEMMQLDPSSRSAVNVNTPGEWEEASRQTEGETPR